MSYATVQDLQDRLGEARLRQLTDLADPPAGAVDAAVAQKALDDATDEIDGYLVGSYALPLAAPPGVLRVHCVTIAHYRLLGAAVDDATKDDYKAARDYLTRVGSGQIPLMPPDQAPPQSGIGSVIFDPGSKVMGREGCF